MAFPRYLFISQRTNRGWTYHDSLRVEVIFLLTWIPPVVYASYQVATAQHESSRVICMATFWANL